MDGYIAQIIMFGSNFAPRNWMFCDGQLLAIAQNTAFFSLVGTIYGGDGRTTFGVPDLRGRVPMHPGSGPGLTTRQLGQKGGVENVTLNPSQIPQHNHAVAIGVSNVAGGEGNAAGQVIANHAAAFNEDPTAGQSLGGLTQSNVGGSLSHTNIQPFQCVNFVICAQGIFPSRN